MAFVAGIDFGTTNSSAAISNGGTPKMVSLEQSFDTIPTALYFPNNKPGVYYGRDAMARAIDNESIAGYNDKEEDNGRFMRSIKRALGTNLMTSGTLVKGKMLTFDKIILYFMRHLKEKIDIAANESVESVVVGRPVHFVDNDLSADQRAQDELKKIATDAGFKNIEFQYEPIAAAFAHERALNEEQLAAVIDIGGGTSDFTIIKLGGNLKNKFDRSDDILANSGTRIGGNDFDKNLALAEFMPEFGKGTQYGGRTKYDPVLTVPVGHFHDLSDWGRVNLLYTYKNINNIKKCLWQAHDKERYGRLLEVIEKQLGHKVLSSVEKTKIHLTNNDVAHVVLDFLSDSPQFTVQRTKLEESISPLITKVSGIANDCVTMAGIKPSDVRLVVLTGGSTEVPYVREVLCSLFQNAKISAENKLASVGLGLTYDAMRKFKTR